MSGTGNGNGWCGVGFRENLLTKPLLWAGVCLNPGYDSGSLSGLNVTEFRTNAKQAIASV